MNISIAIPDSCLADDSTQLDKTRKISQIARACAIFRIQTIFSYQEKGSSRDKSLLNTILRYLDTPPFLRKRLFPRVNELKYAGVLSPLKIPSHVTPSNPKKIKQGDIREGIVVVTRGRKFVDVGINELVPYFGKEELGKRITIQFKKGYPDFQVKDIEKTQAIEYWGYTVKERANLFATITSWKGKIIVTSRKGRNFTENIKKEYINSKEPILLVFGSTDKGVHEILGNKMKQLQNAKVLNFFPNQATETVRLEEAILGILSILNSH